MKNIITQVNSKSLSSKFEWLLIITFFAVVIRFWNINNPVLESQIWKQIASAMVAKNYVTALNFFNPQVNLNVPYPMAFGLHEYLTGILGHIFGYHDFLGRIVSLAFFFLGYAFFYKLALRYFGEPVALWALAFYSFLPNSVYYSRAFMGDSCMVSMTIVFIYFFSKWVDENSWADFLLGSLALCLALLFKIVSAFVFIPAFCYLIAVRKFSWVTDWRIYAFFALAVLFPAFFHWYVPIATNGEIYSAVTEQDKWGTLAIFLTPKWYFNTFYTLLTEYHLTHTGYFFFLFGLLIKMQKKEQALFYGWLLGLIMFGFVAAKGIGHDYYYMPFIPLGCIFIGRFLSSFYSHWNNWWHGGFSKQFVAIFVSLMLLYSVGFSILRVYDREKLNMYYLALSQIVSNNTNPRDNILVMSKNEGEIFYYANRRGTHVRDYDSLADITHNFGSPSELSGNPIEKYGAIVVTDFNLKDDRPTLYSNIKKNYQMISESAEGMVFKRL